MSKWMCSECSYQMDAEIPPETCPSCKKICVFSDVTCYIPDCGGEQNVDPRLVDAARQRQALEGK
ncbi:MAG: hypothetical protein SVM79_00965 [Chloroflexota bacterium]|nr:hypothetical protein [Chloroflexota bacterium]